MEDITSPTLRAKLAQKQKELDLVLAIDHIRDSAPEPTAMLVAIANTLAGQFRADVCLMFLRERESDRVELKAISDHGQRLSQFDVTRELAERIMRLNDITIWKGDEAHAALGLGSGQRDALSEVQGALEVAAIPIILGADEHLGALLLVCSQAPFDERDVALLKCAESQVDSAVIQTYAYHDLQQRTKELETVYRIDHIRDRDLPFDEMLNVVLHELCTTIQAEIGFVMLYNRAGNQLELRAVTRDDLFGVAARSSVVEQAANQALERAELICYNDLGDVLHSLMCIPLILQDEIIGVLGVANGYRPHGFNTDDRQLMTAIASQMDTAIFESLERRRLRQVLGRSVDPRVMERLLENPDVGFLEGERSVLTVLYADMRGSTGLAERTAPDLLVGFINEYLGRMTDVILSHEATLDKFVGDEVMALFGAPFPQPDHALRATRVGLEMQTVHKEVMETWRARGIEPAPIGVGIATGELTVGEMGSSQRTDYTVIGRAANLGARICSAAKAGQVLVSQATYDLIRDDVKAIPIAGLQLKGVDHDVTAYHVVGIL